MNNLIIYHGSANIIEKPEYGKGKEYNDYGRGFYCTESLELAKEWGCSVGKNGFANCYSLEIKGLSVLNLTTKEFSILNWLAILMENRIGRLDSPIEKRGREYLLNNFLPDYKDYDVIIGYRADDSYFSFARAFVGNTISFAQLEHAMNLGNLGEQVVVRSEKAFDSLHYFGYEVADSNVYFTKKKTRDGQAREEYQKQLEAEDINGIYMRDIIREEMKPDDSRLR